MVVLKHEGLGLYIYYNMVGLSQPDPLNTQPGNPVQIFLFSIF